MHSPPRANRVRFLPEGVWVEAEADETLHSAAMRVGIDIAGGCGGQGTCGKCRVRVLSGKVKTGMAAPADRGVVRACVTRPLEDVIIDIPIESRLDKSRATIADQEVDAGTLEAGVAHYPLDQLAKRFVLRTARPSSTDTSSDLSRLTREIKKALSWTGKVDVGVRALRSLPETLRAGDFEVTAWLAFEGERVEILALDAGSEGGPCLGLAVDVGTTSVAVYLVDMESGRTLQRVVTYNGQFVYGEDVITRIIAASRSRSALEKLRRAVLETVNRLISSTLEAEGVEPERVACAVISANTTMSHLFLGLDARNIRLEPYVPVANIFPPIKARDLDLRMNPEGYVFVLPCPGSYVGGDAVAGALVSRISERDRFSMLVDIGTNGEVVLGNRDLIVAAACSMGPAFEGSGITCGMRSVFGAVNRVSIEDRGETVRVETIGGGKAIGLCGSGLVELLAAMLDAGVVDEAGRLTGAGGERVRSGLAGPEFVLLSASENGLGRDLTIAQSDIKNLILAKAALYAGIRHLMDYVGLAPQDLDSLYVAGAFGTHVNLEAAVRIGMFPDIDPDKFVVVGNSSVKGARLSLLSRQALRSMEDLARKMTYVELSADPAYMDHFVSASFLPHTDLSQFPSVSGSKGGAACCERHVT